MAPSKGLWFNDSHFNNWSPKEMAEIFEGRAARIEKAKIGDWEQSSVENFQVFKAIKELHLY